MALAAGYIDAPPAELVMAPRKQVLVAVTSNWQVLCLDHNLKLRWETTILVCSNACTKHQAPSCGTKLPDVHLCLSKVVLWSLQSGECFSRPTESTLSRTASKQSDMTFELGALVQVQLLYVTVYLLFVTAYSLYRDNAVAASCHAWHSLGIPSALLS